MIQRHAMLAAMLTIGLTACASKMSNGDATGDLSGIAAGTQLRNSAGRVVGSASVTQVGDGLRVIINSDELSPGPHGAHVHTVGACTPPTFDSAGPHWNPSGRQHGIENPRGPHLGDMPNLDVGGDGKGRLDFTIASVRLQDGDRPLLDADGASVVIHASADDHRTDPSGNSGGRIACGVLEPIVVR